MSETTRRRRQTAPHAARSIVITGSDVAPTIGRPEMLIDGSDQVFRRLIHGLLTFFALHQAIRDSYAAHVGLGGVQYTILQSIRHLDAGREVSITDVAEHLHLSGSFVTIETKKLEGLGLVQKRTGSGDRRRVALTVTKRGAKLLNDLAPLQRTVNDVQFANINRNDFLWLVAMVQQLIGSSKAALTLQHYLTGSHAKLGLPTVDHAPRSAIGKSRSPRKTAPAIKSRAGRTSNPGVK